MEGCEHYVSRQVAFLCISKSLTQLSPHIPLVRMMLFAAGNAALCIVLADRRIAWHSSVPTGISLTKSTLRGKKV
jgi:hypothetical protein